jgi:hypothetical protein
MLHLVIIILSVKSSLAVSFFDKEQGKYVQSSTQVTNTFSQNPLIQQTLGYNQTSLQNFNYPSIKKLSVPKFDQVQNPNNLQNSFPGHNLTQVFELQLNSKQALKKGHFILVFPSPPF